MSIRRHRYRHVSLSDLVELGVMSELLRQFFAAAVLGHRNILICGAPGIGKTTFLRGLASVIPAQERIWTIEDIYELRLDQDPAHLVVTAAQTRDANIEGEGAITQEDLVVLATRGSPERMIVGEIRGPEIVAFFAAMNMGVGGMSTIHASSSEQAPLKAASYAGLSSQRLSLEASNLLFASAVQLVVYLTTATDGRRVVSSVRT
ncbi:CpaF/VirB11 family protein [Fodinicola feengrottensis]|uniref:CpaF/VirB11 family protein n=1 Tax=Fodinicola feengrottensis TaxID=435914 RepID=UPI0024413F0C|nr:CpaF/VirB11 family protein [Fodinicola feengrottensis]